LITLQYILSSSKKHQTTNCKSTYFHVKKAMHGGRSVVPNVSLLHFPSIFKCFFFLQTLYVYMYCLFNFLLLRMIVILVALCVRSIAARGDLDDELRMRKLKYQTVDCWLLSWAACMRQTTWFWSLWKNACSAYETLSKKGALQEKTALNCKSARSTLTM
jgi:hypothetical protein